MATGTYDPITTDKDAVRFLTGDTTDPYAFSDQEIEAILTQLTAVYGPGPCIKWLASSILLDGLWARWVAQSGGKTSESVSKLSISRGIPDGSGSIKDRSDALWARGTECLAGRPKFFAVVGPSTR